MKIKTVMASLIGLVTLGVGLSAQAAYDGITVGTVATVEVAGPGNFNFWLTGSPNLCTVAADKTIGIVQSGVAGVTPEGQKALLATVTAAYLSGRKVRVYAYNSGGCAIAVVDLIP